MSMNVQQINDLRRRILAGEEVPREELEAALELTRQQRSTAPAGKVKKETSVPADMDLNDLFGGK